MKLLLTAVSLDLFLIQVEINYKITTFLYTFRLGIYQHADNYGLLRDENGKTQVTNSLVFGSISGMCGAFFGSPLQLVKTQLMSYSSEKIAVGTQHAHRGLTYAMKKIYKENGLAGLWRGAHGMMFRNSLGSASQIASYAV